jgi:hypothetical protein
MTPSNICRLDDVQVFLGNFLSTDVEEIIRNLKPLHKDSRRTYVRRLFSFLKSSDAAVEQLRIAAVKLAISLLPESASMICDLLQQREKLIDFEIHFTLFCYLGSAHLIDDNFAQALPGILREYLFKAKHNKAQATWMCCDLLGDHWPVASGLPILLLTATDAPFAAPREAAVSGLGQLIRRVGFRKQRVIRSVLRTLARNDRSKSVRTRARMILNGLAV